MPACSSASQATSRSIRCCGSIASASRGVIPKNSASKPATSETNPPHLVVIRPGAGGRDRSRHRRPSGPREPPRPHPHRRASTARNWQDRARHRESDTRSPPPQRARRRVSTGNTVPARMSSRASTSRACGDIWAARSARLLTIPLLRFSLRPRSPRRGRPTGPSRRRTVPAPPRPLGCRLRGVDHGLVAHPLTQCAGQREMVGYAQTSATGSAMPRLDSSRLRSSRAISESRPSDSIAWS